MQTRDFTRSRWWMPAFCLFLGAVMFGAFAIGGNVGQGAFSFGIMAALGARVRRSGAAARRCRASAARAATSAGR